MILIAIIVSCGSQLLSNGIRYDFICMITSSVSHIKIYKLGVKIICNQYQFF